MRGLLLGISVALGAGCAKPGCDGVQGGVADGAPVIRSADLVQQEIANPWTVICELDFIAPKANLEGGKLLVYSSGTTKPDAEKELDSVLMQSFLPFDSDAGRLNFSVPFQPTVQNGQTIRLGLQLESGAGALRSNCYQLDLSFTVQALAQAATNLLGRAPWAWL